MKWVFLSGFLFVQSLLITDARGDDTFAPSARGFATFPDAEIEVSLAEDLAIFRYQLALHAHQDQPELVFVPLVRGRLAHQASSTGALALSFEEENPESIPWSQLQIRLPGKGKHLLSLEIHRSPDALERWREAIIPHPGATVSQLRVNHHPRMLLDESALPLGVRSRQHLLAAFLPDHAPLTLSWRQLPPAESSGIAVQESDFRLTLQEGELKGDLDLTLKTETPLPFQTLTAALPDRCVVLAARGNALESWRVLNNQLVLKLRAGIPPPHHIQLETLTPITSEQDSLSLPLLQLSEAQRAAGVLSFHNASPHALEDFSLPPEFRSLPPNATSSASGSFSFRERYRFETLPAPLPHLVLSPIKGRSQIHLQTQVSWRRTSAQIRRTLRVTAKHAPLFSTSFTLPAGERLAGIQILEGNPRLVLSGERSCNMGWSHGLAPESQTLLKISSTKPLTWDSDRSDFLLQPPTLEADQIKGLIEVAKPKKVHLFSVGSPDLLPIPAEHLAPGTAAAWTHQGLPAVELSLERTGPPARASLTTVIAPRASGTRVSGELHLHPGAEAVRTLQVALDHAPISGLRISSPLLSGYQINPSSKTLTASFQKPIRDPVSIPWKLSLPSRRPEDVQTGQDGRRYTLQVPRVRISGVPLFSEQVAIRRSPFSSLTYDFTGFQPLPRTNLPHLRETPPGELEAAFHASSPEASLIIASHERGTRILSPWIVESMSLRSVLHDQGPHLHHCGFRLAGSSSSRPLAVQLPGNSTLLELTCNDLPIQSLMSPQEPSEFLIPLPASRKPYLIRLSYSHAASSWKNSGEETLLAPRFPTGTVTHQSEWEVSLPESYTYSDTRSNLEPVQEASFPSLPVSAFHGLRQFMTGEDHKFDQPDFTSGNRAEESAIANGDLKFSGNFQAAEINFRYLHWKTFLLTVVLWILLGAISFYLIARESPLYLGLFGALLLTFLPLSGISAPENLADCLLIGWLTGAAFLAAAKLRRVLRRFRPQIVRKGLLLLALCLGIINADAQSFPSGYAASSHHIRFDASEALITSEYTAILPDEGPHQLPIPVPELEMISLSINGHTAPPNFTPYLTVSGAGSHTIQASYQLELSPRFQSLAWSVAPATASTLRLSGTFPNSELQVNEGLPLATNPDGSLTVALGGTDHVTIAVREGNAPRKLPEMARIQGTLGLMPGLQKLHLDVNFLHPGSDLRSYSLEFPSHFSHHRIHHSGDFRVHQQPGLENRVRLDLHFTHPQRDQLSIRLDLEAPLSARLTSLPCPRIVPFAAASETNLTLAADPRMEVSLKEWDDIVFAPIHLPADWDLRLPTKFSLRVTDSPVPLKIQLRPITGARYLHLHQLALLHSARIDTLGWARFQSPAPWRNASFELLPGFQVKSVSGDFLVDWKQDGEALLLRHRPGTPASDARALIEATLSSTREVPRLLSTPLTLTDFQLQGDRSVAVATSLTTSPPEGFWSATGSAASGPFSIRAPLEWISAPEFEPQPPSSQLTLVISPANDQALLDLHVALHPGSKPIEELQIQIPAELPPLEWVGQHLRAVSTTVSNEHRVYTLQFSGPVQDLTTITGSCLLRKIPGSLRLPVIPDWQLGRQERFFVLNSSHHNFLEVSSDGIEEISLPDLPYQQRWLRSARFYRLVAPDASILIRGQSGEESRPRPAPSVIDLHIQSSLRRNGSASHRAIFQLILPDRESVVLELPSSASLLSSHLNGSEILTRGAPSPGPETSSYLLALPPEGFGSCPAQLELLFQTLPETPVQRDRPRREFRLQAPRLEGLSVAHTTWEVNPPSSDSLHRIGGNLYALSSSDYFQHRLTTDVHLAGLLRRTLEEEFRVSSERRSLLYRILALTSAHRVPLPSPSPTDATEIFRDPEVLFQENQSHHQFALERLREEQQEEEPASTIHSDSTAHRRFRENSTALRERNQELKQARLQDRQRVQTLIPVSEHVFLEPEFVPWLATRSNNQGNPTETTPTSVSPAPRPPSVSIPQPPSRPASPASPSSSRTSEEETMDPPGANSEARLRPYYFRKLKGDAQLHLIASRPLDWVQLQAWCWFLAVITTLFLARRVPRIWKNRLGKQRKPSPDDSQASGM